MIKKVLVSILFTLFLISLNNNLDAATLKLLERQGPPGSFVQVPITFNGADSLAGVEFVLQYDPAVLDFIQIDSTFGLATEFLIAWRHKLNKISISMARATGLSNKKGTLLAITFRIKSSASVGTVTDIFWRETALYNEATISIDHDTEDGMVKVSEISVYPNPFTPNGDGFNDTVNFVVPDSIASDVVIKIFGISSKKIKEFSKAEEPTLQWDGYDADGQLLHPGVYLYLILRNEEPIHKGTITLMR